MIVAWARERMSAMTSTYAVTSPCGVVPVIVARNAIVRSETRGKGIWRRDTRRAPSCASWRRRSDFAHCTIGSGGAAPGGARVGPRLVHLGGGGDDHEADRKAAPVGVAGEREVGRVEPRAVVVDVGGRGSRLRSREVRLAHQHRLRPRLVGLRDPPLGSPLAASAVPASASTRRRASRTRRRIGLSIRITARTQGSGAASARSRPRPAPCAARSPRPGRGRPCRGRSSAPADGRGRGRSRSPRASSRTSR